MRPTLLAVPLAILTIVGLSPGHAAAQEAKKARGKVTALTATQLSVDVAGKAMNFAIDDKTRLEATGAGTASRRAEARGEKAVVKLADFVKAGDAVEVSYTEAGGAMHAANIRKVASVGSAGGSMATESKSSSGKVTAVSATSLTISGSSGGGATFTQTFVIDAATKVVGRGAGTAAAKTGGKIAVTEVVHNGDTVSVSFRETGGTLHAGTVTVTMKAAAK